MTLAEMIRTYRKEKGYTQEQLAKMIGVSANNISIWERGTFAPSARNSGKLFELLGITPESYLANILGQNKMRFGEQLKAYRKAKGYTQKDLAEKIGTTLLTISVWERGVFRPNARHCKLLYDLFNLDTETHKAHLDLNQSFGQILKDTRRKAGYTRAHLAQVLGISVLSLFRWEHDISLPSPKNWKLISEFFDISSNEAFDTQPAASSPGEQIRNARYLKGYSKTDFAKKLGVAQMTLWAWETDRITPHPKHITRLSELLDLDVNKLLDSVKYPGGLGRLIRQKRLEKGLNQKELSKRVGVSRQVINMWENNHMAPKPDSWKRLAEFLEIPVDVLLDFNIVRQCQNLGQVIAKKREEKGYSQIDLAVKTGMTLPMIKKWEMNSATPKRENWKRVVEVLDITPKDIQDAG